MWVFMDVLAILVSEILEHFLFVVIVSIHPFFSEPNYAFQPNLFLMKETWPICSFINPISLSLSLLFGVIKAKGKQNFPSK